MELIRLFPSLRESLAEAMYLAPGAPIPPSNPVSPSHDNQVNHVYNVSPMKRNEPQPVEPLGCNHFEFDTNVLPPDAYMLAARDPPLFIECTIGPCYVKRVLVDCGSGLNVVSYDALFNMHYTDADIQVTRSTCRGYDERETVPVGAVQLPITVGPCTFVTQFL